MALKKPGEIWTVAQARAHFNKPTKSAGRQPARKKQKKSAAKSHIKMVLLVNKVAFVEELQFDETGKRKFRFDWAIPSHKIAIEYEGLMSGKSRHTTVGGFSKDTTKYNLALAQGWRVYRYTALTYLDFEKDLILALSSSAG
jgi:hypothetical protein